MSDVKFIEGAGGGDLPPPTARASIEADDTLQSKASIGIIDLIGEGEIGGLVNGAESIFLNDTPLMNADGSFNFPDVTWEERKGTQNQLPVSSSATFKTIATPVGVGAPLKFGAPHTVSISNPQANQVTVIIAVAQLMKQDKSSGDIGASDVSYKVELSLNGNAYTELEVVRIEGKTRSRYQRSTTYQIPYAAIRHLRVQRVTPDAEDSSVMDEISFDSYIEEVTTVLNYPNSAYIAISLNAAQFSSIPRRSYLVDGLHIRLPSNYNPVTRQYSEIWDGSLNVVGVSNNPAWIMYDLLTNERYGLGEYITPAQVDKAMLYQIGRYCDELVPDGMGGYEPRFVCNIVINTLMDAYRMISQLSSVFRGMGFWSGSEVGFTFDAPHDPVMIFNQANVVDGMFSYVGSSRKNRHSVALITWNDPAEGYKQKIEYVEDAELMAKVGVRKTDMVAFGCTSRAQAHRLGRWILYTEKYESQIINFKVGIDSVMVMPGEIVKIHDDHRAGKRMGGRIKSATIASVELDVPIELTVSSGVLIMMRKATGEFVERTVIEGIGTHSSLTYTPPLEEPPLPGSIYIVSEPNLVPMTARVISISQGDKPGTYSISAIENNPTKYDAIENGYKLEQPITTAINFNAVGAPENVTIVNSRKAISESVLVPTILVSWSGTEPNYQVAYRRKTPTMTETKVITTSYPSVEIEGVTSGEYEISVVAINGFGKQSRAVVSYFTSSITDTEPVTITGLVSREEWVGRTATVEWNPVAFVRQYHVQVLVGGVVKRDTVIETTYFEYTEEMAVSDGGPYRDISIRVKAVKPSGLESPTWAALDLTNPPPQISSLKITPGYLAIYVSYERPADTDFVGVQIWLSDTSGFTPSNATLKYDGDGSSMTFLTDATDTLLQSKPYFIRLRPYDVFGKSGAPISVEYEVTPVSASLGLGPGEIAGSQIAIGAISAEKLKSRRHMID